MIEREPFDPLKHKIEIARQVITGFEENQIQFKKLAGDSLFEKMLELNHSMKSLVEFYESIDGRSQDKT